MDDVLKMIEEYDIYAKPIGSLFHIIKGMWKWSEDGFDIIIKGDEVRVHMSTMGWSENEELIMALEKNRWIGIFWQSSVRGGIMCMTYRVFYGGKLMEVRR